MSWRNFIFWTECVFYFFTAPFLIEAFHSRSYPEELFDSLNKSWTIFFIQSPFQSLKNGSHEFEIKGNPFWCESTEAIQTRFLMIKILESLLEKGFRVQTAINPSSRLINKSLMIFRWVIKHNIASAFLTAAMVIILAQEFSRRIELLLELYVDELNFSYLIQKFQERYTDAFTSYLY